MFSEHLRIDMSWMSWLWLLIALVLGERAMAVWDIARIPLWLRGPLSVLLIAAGGGIFYAGFWTDGRTPEEAAHDKAAAAVQAEMDRQAAALAVKQEAILRACRAHARDQAIHRSTVAFEREVPPKINADGSAVAGLRFRVKNSFGLDLTYGLLCAVSAKGEASGLVFEVDK